MLPQNNMAPRTTLRRPPLGRVPGCGFLNMASSEVCLWTPGENAPAL